jgi:hypothetical protein
MRGRTRRHERGAECGGREGADRRTALFAYGEVVWSWRAHAGAKLSQSSKGFAPATVANAGSPGRAPISRKTTAQGRPECLRLYLWFSRSRNFFSRARAPGAAATRPSLRPRSCEGRNAWHNSGGMRREKVESCLPAVIASEAKQSRVVYVALDCFVALLLAMTAYAVGVDENISTASSRPSAQLRTGGRDP